MRSSSSQNSFMPANESQILSSVTINGRSQRISSGSQFRSSEFNDPAYHSPSRPVGWHSPDEEFSDMHCEEITDHQVEDDRDMTNEVILSIDAKDRCIGCCYYSSQNETTYFMEDMKMGGMDVVDTCKGG